MASYPFPVASTASDQNYCSNTHKGGTMAESKALAIFQMIPKSPLWDGVARQRRGVQKRPGPWGDDKRGVGWAVKVVGTWCGARGYARHGCLVWTHRPTLASLRSHCGISQHHPPPPPPSPGRSPPLCQQTSTSSSATQTCISIRPKWFFAQQM